MCIRDRVVLRDGRARRVDAAPVAVALGVGQVVDDVGEDRLGGLEAERGGVADVELEHLVALGLQPLSLGEDRSPHVVPDMLQLVALSNPAHGGQSVTPGLPLFAAARFVKPGSR